MTTPTPAQRLNAAERADEIARAKQTAHLAFLAYQVAVREGDKAGADAAQTRFLKASDVLQSAQI